MQDAPALTLNTGLSRQTIEALSARKAEPAWMRDRRLLAWRIFDETPMPFWRRTDLSGLKLNELIPYHSVSISGGAFAGLPSRMTPVKDERWYSGLTLQRDSEVVFSALSRDLEAKGVILVDLDTALQKHPQLVKDYMMTSAVPMGEDKFTALHGALWSGGVLLYVPRHLEITMPVASYTHLDTPGLAIFTHTLIIAEEGSKVSFLEEVSSPEEQTTQSFHSGVVEIFVGQNASVSYAKVQNWGPAVYTISNEEATVNRDGHMHWTAAHLGSRLARNRIHTVLNEPGANMEMLGVYLASGRQHMDMDSLTNHQAPNTKGDVLYRGIIRDRARTVFEGLIKVEKQAQKTDSYLANHNLLLSPRARADSLPTLEIEANDVRCTHGATVGQIDEEQLFYMRCRGLSRGQAEQLIVGGFIQPVLDRAPEGAVRARLTSAAHARLAADES